MKRTYKASQLQKLLEKLNTRDKSKRSFSALYEDFGRNLLLNGKPVAVELAKNISKNPAALKNFLMKKRISAENVDLLMEYHCQLDSKITTFFREQFEALNLFFVVDSKEAKSKRNITQVGKDAYLTGSFGGTGFMNPETGQIQKIPDKIEYVFKLTKKGIELVSLTIDGKKLNDFLSGFIKKASSIPEDEKSKSESKSEGQHLVPELKSKIQPPATEAKVLRPSEHVSTAFFKPAVKLQKPHPINLLESRVMLAEELKTKLEAYDVKRSQNKNEYYGVSWFKLGYSRTDKLAGANYVIDRLAGKFARQLTEKQKEALFSSGSDLGKIIKNEASQKILKEKGIWDEIVPKKEIKIEEARDARIVAIL